MRFIRWQLFGHLLGIAYQIHDDLVDWNNEDRLFNALIRKNNTTSEIVSEMEELYLDYSNRAKDERGKLQNSLPQELTWRGYLIWCRLLIIICFPFSLLLCFAFAFTQH